MATTGTDIVQESDGSFSKQVQIVGGSGGTIAVTHAALTELAAAIDTEVQVDVVGALPAGTANIGRVGASVVEIAGTLDGANPGVIAAAGNYAAGDVMSNDAAAGAGDPWLFSNIARESGGSGTITRALLICNEDSILNRVRLWLFNAAPTTTEMDDNEAFNLDNDDIGKVVGYLDFPAFADQGEPSVALWTGALPFKCGADAHLRGITQTLDAETNETAGMTFTLKLQAVQD